MARLTGSLYSQDDDFRIQIGGMLRAASIAIADVDDPDGSSATPDLVIVDGRVDVSSAFTTVERLRAADAGTAIFFVAAETHPDLILRAMRAGANEFLTWVPTRETFDDAVRRTAARRASSPSTRPNTNTVVFFGVKGGAGTTTMAVSCGVEIARVSKRPTIIVDLKAGLGEVTLFLGVRSRYSLIDALDNLHRLDTQFMRELVVKHKSGLEILAGSDHFDRPSSSDSGPLEEVLRILGQQYEYVVIDAGSHLGACSTAALYMADSICLVANPDVPCVRNAQRLLDRIGQLGPSGDRVKLLLNRAAEPFPIPPAQIENALGHKIFQMFPSDYKTVSTALNSGVPLSVAGNSDFATQFEKFTRRIVNPSAPASATPPKRTTLGLERIASIW